MKFTRIVLDNPIAGYAGLLFIGVLGIVMLSKIPVQLAPEIESVEIKITTAWRAAAPEEVEAEIIEPQEDALKGLPGLTKLLSQAQFGSGIVSLTFETGYPVERALIEVINRLNRVPSYPTDANEPVLSVVGESSRPIAWFIIKPLPNNPEPIVNYQRFVEETVQSRFERVWGVSLSEIHGGSEQELRISINPYKAASLGVDLPAAAQKISNQDNVSGGGKSIGKRSYTVRFKGAFSLEELPDMVLNWRDGKPVRLRDIADIKLQPQDEKTFVINNGDRSIAINAYRESGVNVLDVMRRLQKTATALAAGPLKQAGLSLEQVYDETIYIEDAILLLFSNLGLGIFLAGFVLWWFVRRYRLAFIIGISIPVSLLAAFIVLHLTGRTLNLISLAALALAVGMVLDASIIALENILRLRENKYSPHKAALEGALQVKQALIASTATTVAIFLPILLLEDEAGQMFADLALGLSAAIIISLFVALIIVPLLSKQWLRDEIIHDPFSAVWDCWTARLLRLTDARKKRRVLVLLLFVIPITLIILFLPKADYLPAGQRNLVFAYLLPPPGINIETMRSELGAEISRQLAPHINGEKEPEVSLYFFVAFQEGAFMGLRARDPDHAEELVPLANDLFRDFPDTLAFARRASLFTRGDTRSIDVNIQGRDIASLLTVAFAGYGLISQQIPGARVNPRPGLELADPQLRLLPKEERIAEIGWGREQVGMLVRAAGEGLYITDFFDGEKKINVIARLTGWNTLEDLTALPLASPAGVVPFGELVSAERTAGPNSIRRLDRRRTITLEVIAPPSLSLEETLAALKQKVEPLLSPLLPADASISYGGSAGKLETVLSNMSSAFLLALFILYLLISVLFRSFRDSWLILVCIPLAIVGGVLALQLVNLFTFQPMDLLSMIGFVILLGLVVNNAILLVYQWRVAEQAGHPRRESVAIAIRLRLRPILMSTVTSLFGMLPLLLAFGPGTELYRGLATVIIGGLSVSMLFTLILIPCLLRWNDTSVEEAPL